MNERYDRQGADAETRRPGDEPARTQVLIVDDDGAGRLVCENYCDLFDHGSRSVSTGAEAVAALRREAFDVVVLNVHLDGGGLEALRAIRALPAPAGMVPVVGLAAVGKGEEAQRWLAAGLAAVAPKPVSASRFFAAIGAAMVPQGPEPRSWAPAR